MSVEELEASDGRSEAPTAANMRARLIDSWFPCPSVDKAAATPAGSGRSEKALFTWFASRPIAQARAAVLTTLLPAGHAHRDDVRLAIEAGDEQALARLRTAIGAEYPTGRPVVLDVFSGRGIIPLEAARLGVRSVGTDLSPVATLGGRLLADFALRDWSGEPEMPFAAAAATTGLFGDDEPKLLRDVRAVLAEVGRRTEAQVVQYFPRSPNGRFPWAYLWAVTIPCDQCRRRFPLVGSLALRHPYVRTQDAGQSLRLRVFDGAWTPEVIEGTPDQEPTFAAAPGRKGKTGLCLFCGHVHSLDTIKAKGAAGQYEDAMLAVADSAEDSPRKTFRAPVTADVQAAAAAASAPVPASHPFSPIPDEVIPAGNTNTIQATVFGYRTFGDLMLRRQSLLLAGTIESIRILHEELLAAGCSADYSQALAGFAAANLPRRIRYSTRGAKLRPHGSADGTGQNRVQVGDIFSNESVIICNLDYLETGLGDGPGTWGSVSEVGLNALRKILAESGAGQPARIRRASAVSLPFRDGTVDAVITDPPYYDMITYADASDIFYVWLKRALAGIVPDLFAPDAGAAEGLQDKTDEIIVKSRDRGGSGEHRTREFYERMLSRAFGEARRVLRPDGHLVVVFGHSDPDAWLRLLGALRDAGFIVTSSWPSRTETAATGVASIKVTVTIGCRVAATNRPMSTAAQVDREVATAVKAAVRQWDQDGLALTDQLMAAYGPAMEVYGRYNQVLLPNGEQATLDRYLTLARTSVRDATALKLDQLPLETFDAPTRFAVFWQRLYGRTDVPKGEARFLAQADNLRLEDMRGPLLVESKSGFKLRLDAPDAVTDRSSTFQVVRAMAKAWDDGGTEAVAIVLARADRPANDVHLWAVVAEIVQQLPASDQVAKALTAVQRNAGTIGTMIEYVAAAAAAEQDAQKQLALSYGEDDQL